MIGNSFYYETRGEWAFGESNSIYFPCLLALLGGNFTLSDIL